MFSVAIIGNGDSWNYAQQLLNYDVIIAADGGANHCATYGIIPHYIIGDGDSITEYAINIFSEVPYHTLPDQNSTDLQKALQLAKKLSLSNLYCIDLYSVTSNTRLDHTLAAMQAVRTQPKIRHVYTAYEKISSVHEHAVLNEPIGTTVSLVPVSPTAIVQLRGFQWSGEHIVLDQQQSGISNITIAPEAHITVQKGHILMLTRYT